MNLFGGGKVTKKLRMVPRAPGDTTPLDPKVAEALRNAGMDPEKFTVAPYEEGEKDAPLDAFKPGTRVEHAFVFASLNAALSAIERLVDDQTPARISREAERWRVVFDEPAQAGVSGAVQHERLASRISSLGAEDRGFSHLTMNVTRWERK